MSREVVIIGVGMHRFGKFPGKMFTDLGVVACREALKDAGMDWNEIEAVVAGVDSWSGTAGLHAGNALAQVVGTSGIPIFNTIGGCATGGLCLEILCARIASGMCDTGLAIGMGVSPQGFLPALARVVEDPHDLDSVRFKMTGLPNPGYWAIAAARRMHDYGTTENLLAKIRVKNSRHGSLNPFARYRKIFTMEEILNSPMVCYPLRLYGICALSDGAAAVIACTKEAARKYTTKAITVASCASATLPWDVPTFAAPPYISVCAKYPSAKDEVAIAALRAFERAGVGPEDLDLIELPDHTAWHELEYLEKIGICGIGEADHLADEGATQIGGRIPVCASGGFLSFGEATPAMGLLQACEIVWQLRGQAGPRQVENAKVGYAQTTGIYANNSAFILKR